MKENNEVIVRDEKITIKENANSVSVEEDDDSYLDGALFDHRFVKTKHAEKLGINIGSEIACLLTEGYIMQTEEPKKTPKLFEKGFIKGFKDMFDSSDYEKFKPYQEPTEEEIARYKKHEEERILENKEKPNHYILNYLIYQMLFNKENK